MTDDTTRTRRPRRGKLTDDQILEVYRRTAIDGESALKVAADYPVTEATIRQIRDGKIRADLTGADPSARHERKPVRGETHGRTTLSNDQVLAIYRRAWAGEETGKLADEYLVLPPVVSRIKYGTDWAWLTGHVGRGAGGDWRAKLTAKQAKAIYKRAWLGGAGNTLAAIAEDFGVSRATVSDIKTGRIWVEATKHRRQGA